MVAADQQLVRHHRDERRRQRHGQPVVDAVVQQAVEDADDRDVGLGQRLEEPVLLEELRVLGVADVREVGVEDGAPVPGGHGLRLAPEGVAGAPGTEGVARPAAGRAAPVVAAAAGLGRPVDGRRAPRARGRRRSPSRRSPAAAAADGRQLAGVAVAHPPPRALRARGRRAASRRCCSRPAGGTRPRAA